MKNMKQATAIVLQMILFLLPATIANNATAQTTKTVVAVLNIEAKDISVDAHAMTHMVRLELEKTNVFTVMDRYEAADILAKNKIDAGACMSKTCLVETGKLLGADKMLSGSAELLGEKIVITLRLIDVNTNAIEKTDVTEYLNLPELQKMSQISVMKIAGLQPNRNMSSLLVDYDVPIQSPKNTMRLNGPRIGFGMTLGEAGKVIVAPKEEGGFEMSPVTFNFGWQQEIQYVSAGNFQGLIENIFLIGGLESGRFIPNYAPLLGFRFGQGSWEFAFGPTFRFVRKAEGFYDTDGLLGTPGEWHLTRDWQAHDPAHGLPYTTQTRIDSRGNVRLSTGLVIGLGKTFHSGYLNIPVNTYIAPKKDGTTIGVTCGFNIQKKEKKSGN
jgi:hypothetical protein